MVTTAEGAIRAHNKMPRTSEKAQLTSQLQNTWLADILLHTLFKDNDWELLQQFLGPNLSPIRSVHNKHNLHSTGKQIYSDRLRVMREGGLRLEQDLGIGMAFGLVGSGEQEEEIEEWIGFWGMALQEIRYLAPRVPIPHSEYLFTHHVC